MIFHNLSLSVKEVLGTGRMRAKRQGKPEEKQDKNNGNDFKTAYVVKAVGLWGS